MHIFISILHAPIDINMKLSIVLKGRDTITNQYRLLSVNKLSIYIYLLYFIFNVT